MLAISKEQATGLIAQLEEHQQAQVRVLRELYGLAGQPGQEENAEAKAQGREGEQGGGNEASTKGTENI